MIIKNSRLIGKNKNKVLCKDKPTEKKRLLK